MFIRYSIWLLVCLAFSSFAAQATAQNTTSIVAIVNDEPISNHDINMRIKLYLANSKDVRVRLKKKLTSKRTQKLWRKMIEEYQPQSRAEAQRLQKKLVNKLRAEVQSSMKGKLKKKILKELIDERIQLQQANKLGVALTDEDLDERLEQIAKNNKNKKTGKSLTKKEFLNSLKKMGIPVREFRNRMKAKGSWIRVIRRKFQFQVNIGDQDVDRLINTQSKETVKLKTVYTLQRVRLSMSSSADEKTKTERLIKAEKLRQIVTSCKHLKKAVSRINGASLKPLGTKTPDSFPHTMRAYLIHTKKGHLTPPTMTSSGVELYAVCERKQRRIADKSKRLAVKEKLRQQEFEVLARRHLQDLRQEASIEYR
jgi:peptidyl-prolyl cis-trans isomerase SurA